MVRFWAINVWRGLTLGSCGDLGVALCAGTIEKYKVAAEIEREIAGENGVNGRIKHLHLHRNGLRDDELHLSAAANQKVRGAIALNLLYSALSAVEERFSRTLPKGGKEVWLSIIDGLRKPTP